jgi:hypothetical protein
MERILDIFAICSWVDIWWQKYSTHLHTNKKQKNTVNSFGRVPAVPLLCELYPGICLTTEEKARKNLNQGSRRVAVGTVKREHTEQSIHKQNRTYMKRTEHT